MSLKILICTVGGSPQPLITSIEYHKPQRIIYVASQSSRLTIRKDIESMLSFHPEDTQTITLSNEQNLLECVKEIRLELQNKLRVWQLDLDVPLLGDFTGGTKPMSAALVLALMEYNICFTYVGGHKRNKDGLGIVQDGHEDILPLDNPWDALALQELQSMSEAFNIYNFDAMSQIASILSKKADNKSTFYATLSSFAEGYSLWDSFNHKRALTVLQKAKRELTPYSLLTKQLEKILLCLENNILILQSICAELDFLVSNKDYDYHGKQSLYLLDLIANAKRRAFLGRYDDALARLYSAIEKVAKIRLRSIYQIDSSNIDLSKIPNHLHMDLEKSRNEAGKIQIPLQRSYQLLLGLNDELGIRFSQYKDEISKQLQDRNKSLLAHGYKAIDEKSYMKLFTIAMDFMNIDESHLPMFPKIQARDLFF